MFISYAFPVQHFGKLYGITRVCGGLFTLLAAPIFDFVLEQGNKFKNANFDFAVVIGESVTVRIRYLYSYSLVYVSSYKCLAAIVKRTRDS